MRALEKNDRGFLLSLLFFCLIAASRMFDHEMVFHSAPMGIMQDYQFAGLVQTAYFLSLFLFFAMCLKMTDAKRQTEMYYLIMLLCVFVVPLYLYSSYFGSMDVYAWILMMAGMLCMMRRKAEWLLVPFSFASACIGPMSCFYCICPMMAMLFYQAQKQDSRKYAYLTASVFAGGAVGAGLAFLLHYFTTDAQQTLSWHKFVIVCVLLSPYLLIVLRFWEGVLQKSGEKMRPAYVCLALSQIPALFVTAYIQDFARMLFLFFALFLYQVLFLLSVGDGHAGQQLAEIRKTVCDWIAVPAVLIAYPLVIMTLWVYGPLQIIVETLLGN